MIIKPEPITENVSLTCDHSSGPGASWHAEVEFRVSKEGFSVWQYDLGEGRLVKAGESKGSLAWRTIVDWLRSPRIDGLAGYELISDICVSGIESVFSDLCAIAWIQYENELESLLDFMLELPDDEILDYYNLIGPFAEENASYRLDCLNESIVGDTEDFPIRRIIEEIDWQKTLTFDEVIGRVYNLSDVYDCAGFCDFNSSSLSAIKSAVGLPDSAEIEELLGLLKAASERKLPILQAERDKQLEEFLSRVIQDDDLTSKTFDECFKIGARCPETHASALLHLWERLKLKPTSEATSEFPDPELTALSWILDGFSKFALKNFIRDNPKSTQSILEWLTTKHGHFIGILTKKMGSGMGGAHGAAVLSQKKREANLSREQLYRIIERIFPDSEELKG